jgi:hypothetical protein
MALRPLRSVGQVWRSSEGRLAANSLENASPRHTRAQKTSRQIGAVCTRREPQSSLGQCFISRLNQTRCYSSAVSMHNIASHEPNTVADSLDDSALLSVEDDFVSLFYAPSPLVNIAKYEAPLMEFPDEDWSMPSSKDFLDAIRAKAAMHLLVPDDNRRKAIEFWCVAAALHAGQNSSEPFKALVKECLDLANPHLPLAMVKLAGRQIRVSDQIPRLYCHAYAVASCDLDHPDSSLITSPLLSVFLQWLLSRVYYCVGTFTTTVSPHRGVANVRVRSVLNELVAPSHTKCISFSYSTVYGMKKAKAFLLEGILRIAGEQVIPESLMAVTLLQIAREEPLNVVGALARRWSELKLLSIRRLTCLRVASLGFHRRFDEILDILRICAEDKNILDFRPEDYAFLIRGFMASKPITLAPLIDQLTVLSQFLSPSATTLEPIITSLVKTVHVTDEMERTANFTRALALFSWLVTLKDPPSANCWTIFIELAPENEFTSTCETVMDQAVQLAATNKAAVPAEAIFSAIYEQMTKRKQKVDPEKISAFARALREEPLSSWPAMFKSLSPRKKPDAVEQVIAECGSSGLPPRVLSEVIPFLFNHKGDFGLICQLVDASRSAGHQLDFGFEPIWRMYLEACAVVGKADQIVEFVHPDELAHPGSTISTRIRILASMNRFDLVEKIEQGLSEEESANPQVRSALQQASLGL